MVEGRNLDDPGAFDSNACGKSTLVVEMIPWVLFGKMIRHGNARLSVTDVCYDQHDAHVSVDFATDRGVFRATRRHRPTGSPRLSIQVMRQREWVPLESVPPGVDDATEFLTNLLGFEYATFRSAFCLRGGSTLAGEALSGQLKTLESALRFDVFTRAAKGASEDAKALGRELDGVIRDMERQAATVTDAQRSIRELETLDESDRAQELKDSIARLASVDVSALEEHVERAGKARDSAVTRLRDLARKVEDLEEQEATLREAVQGGYCPTCKQPTAAVRAMHDDVCNSLATARNAHVVMLRSVERAEARFTPAREVLADARRELRDLEQMRAELRDLERRAAHRDAMLQRQVARGQEAQAEVDRLTGEAARLRIAVNDARFWSQIYTKDLRSSVFHLASPILNDAAGYYSRLLSDDALSVSFDLLQERPESIVRVTLGGSPTTYERLSSGEQRRVDIASALALRSVARWRIGRPLMFSVFDEIFDPLDEHGVLRALEVVQQDVDELGTVFVVSHNQRLKALFPGARVLTVTREGGCSRVD